MIIRFGEWLPDQPLYNNPGMTVAKNVIPGASSYLPFRSLTTAIAPLPERARGATAIKSDQNVPYIYAGTSKKLYVGGDLTWTDVTRSTGGDYNLGTDNLWKFAERGNNLFASSITEPLQSIQLGGTNFANHITSTSKPQANHIAVVRGDFLFMGDYTEASTGRNSRGIWHSARGDDQNFDVDPITTQANRYQIDGEDGSVIQIIAGEYATVVAEKAIWRFTYEGSPTVFRQDKIIRDRGSLMPNAVVDFDRTTYFLDEDGFYMFDGTQIIPIGQEKVNRTVLNLIDWNFRQWTSTAVFPELGVVAWAIPVSNSQGLLRRIFFYSWKINRWTEAEVDLELLFPALTQGVNLDIAPYDTLNLDVSPQSDWNLDGPEFIGGLSAMAAFNPDHRLGFFTGAPLTGRLETGEIQPFAPDRTEVDAIRLLAEGMPSATADVYIGVREQQNEVTEWVQAVGNLAWGGNVLAQGRFMKFRADITGEYKHGIAVDIQPKPAGAF